MHKTDSAELRQFLVNHGANPNPKNNEGETPDEFQKKLKEAPPIF